MDLVPKAITRPAARIGAAAQNALEVARFGGLETGDEHAPFEVVAEQRVYRLRRYFAPAGQRRLGSPPQDRPAILLVPPMMLSAEVWDVSPQSSAVRDLHAAGVDPWVVDFGDPGVEEAGLQRTLTDHVLAVSDAVDRVHAATGRDVHLSGYSQGGMFCYQAAAYRRSEGLASLITFGSPVDTRGVLPFGLPEEVVAGVANVLADVLGRAALPAWASRTGFRLLDPAKSLRQRVDFVLALHDREALLPRESQRRFLAGEGFVAWSGPAIAELMRGFVVHNRMLQGGFVIDERLVTLADITCPCLCFVGEVDEIAPPRSVRAIVRAAPRAETYEKGLRAGHFGLVVGSTAARETWPSVAQWAAWRDGGSVGPAPEGIGPMVGGELTETNGTGGGNGRGQGVGYQFELAADVSVGLAKGILGGASRTVRSVREVAREAATQLPRLARLDQIAPGTRISMGLLMDEQARRTPEAICFLFEDRAHSQRDAKRRVDNVVRGLVSIGVRQGEHVGVLMATRPSALTVVAALSRLGAVGVLLRPDGDASREAELGQCTKVVADPDHMHLAMKAKGAHVFVLGGGGEERDLGPNVTDMERIDPDAVDLPAWYRPNPGKASDLAFVLFTGEGARTRATRITNRRWALSAFGTASSAALGEGDTVYSVTPIHHPSGLLMSIGGAIAGGSRLAMAREFDPTTFWDEARRYGVTVAGYTWTLLRDLVEAPPTPRRSITACASSSARACRAVCGSAWCSGSLQHGSSSSTPPPRATRSWSTSPARSPVRWAGASRAAPRCVSRPTTRPRDGSWRAPTVWRASAMPTRSGCSCHGSSRACRRPAARCAACSAAETRGWPPATCSGATPTVTTGSWTTSRRSSAPIGASWRRRRSRTPCTTSPPWTSRSATASRHGRARPTSPSRRSRSGPGSRSRSPTSRTPSACSRWTSARASSTWWTRSR